MIALHLVDRTSILFVEQPVYRPNTPYPGVFSTSGCTMQDVVRSNQALADLSDPYSWDSQSVFPCLNKFWPPGINPEFVIECKLMAHPM